MSDLVIHIATNGGFFCSPKTATERWITHKAFDLIEGWLESRYSPHHQFCAACVAAYNEEFVRKLKERQQNG